MSRKPSDGPPQCIRHTSFAEFPHTECADYYSKPFALRARWVFPIIGPPLRDAAVTVFQGRIVAVGPVPNDIPVEDLGDVALLPGLVNAHTHLEFSDVAEPIGHRGIGLVDWLRLVIEHRRATSDPPHTSPTRQREVEQGLNESIGLGTTTIGEIAQPGQPADPYADSSCDGIRFLELIAPTTDRIASAIENASAYLAASNTTRWQSGLSPHAPYTVHPELLAQAVELSARHRVPLAMHLAESLEEIEFLRDGRGPFRDLLESRGSWDSAARPRGARPLDELRMLARSHRALIVHGNYLDAEEIAFLAQHRDRMAAVFCPRTHDWFGHARYPLEAMLSAGAIVALGTDSRASSPDLSLLAEMRHVAQKFPNVSGSQILQLGTINGAAALGRDREIGTLEPGKWANLAAVSLLEISSMDPHNLILGAVGGVVRTWCRGVAICGFGLPGLFNRPNCENPD